MGGKCVEIYQLRQFAAVAKTENMTRAAQSLSMAQPAVSKTIRNLESELGAELFERTGKGLRRTEQGDILLRYARAILNAELDARREIEESLHRAGGLCICALSCVERLSDILAGFAAEYGNADFRIGSTPEGSDLLLDSAVSRDEVPAGAEVLFDEEICIAVPDGHRFADCGAVSLTELADDPFIALSGSESFQQVSEHIFRSAGIAMHAAIECDSLALQSRLLSCGMGIALAAAGEWSARRAACICCTSATPNAGATSMCSSSAALKRIPCVPSARFCAGIFPKSVKRAPQAARSRLHQTDAGFRASTVPCRTLPGR